MRVVEKIKKQLEPGTVYRRAELEQWSNAVDRHLNQLMELNILTKLSGGLYYCPKTTTFGKAPPSEHALVKAFLKDSRFLIFSWDVYNGLGVGTTQLYSETIVYNHKRHGIYQLGNRKYRFVRKHFFPEKLTKEFLLVDLVNNINKLAEDKEQILKNVALKALNMNRDKLVDAVFQYGGARAKNFFAESLNESSWLYAH